MFYDKRYANSGVHGRLPGCKFECQYVCYWNIIGLSAWTIIGNNNPGHRKIYEKLFEFSKQEMMEIWDNMLEVRSERHNLI